MSSYSVAFSLLFDFLMGFHHAEMISFFIKFCYIPTVPGVAGEDT
jgi:hypothetical protein